MRGDVHVRFSESAGVKFPRATQPFSPPTFSLDGREHLRGVQVDGPDLSAYQGLLGEWLPTEGRVFAGGRS